MVVGDVPIYDQSFRRYTGPRLAAGGLWWPVARQTLRPLGRTRFTKLVGLGALLVVAFFSILLFVSAKLPQVGGSRQAERMASVGEDGPLPLMLLFGRSTGSYEGLALAVMGPQLVMMWLIVVSGAGIVATDLRSHALPLYFSRPLRPWQYIVGKMVGLGLLPAMVGSLSIALVVLQAAGYFGEGSVELARRASLLLKSTAFCLGVGLFMALMMMAASSACRRAATAAVAFVGFDAITLVASDVASWGLRMKAALYFSPRLNFMALAGALFRNPDGTFGLGPGRRGPGPRRGPGGPLALDPAMAGLMLAGYAILAVLIIRRNLKVVEAVK